ncbi:MAG: J domain-containing protein [Cyanobacteria bacterium REEB67]|jgi:curved DNA-binding protein CbpA|nr:J domain-containing protein [Cyanobacteria bacterium REEB67]
MTEQETLQKAYVTFGLEHGSSFEVVKRRYKRLIMVWHPDRFPTAEGKQDAEEELKRINDAKDKLFAHFEKNHKESGNCACRDQAGAAQGGQGAYRNTQGSGAGPGPGKRRTTQENDREEAEAKRRSEERARQAAAEASEKDRKAREAAAAATAQRQTVEDALTQQKRLQEEKLRWKLSVGLCATWLALSFYGWAGTGIKEWWHDVTWKWERDHPSTPAPNTNQTSNDQNSGGNTYIPPYARVPGQDQSSWQQQHDQDQKRRDEEAERQKKQDIYETRMSIDRYQKTIAHCTDEIAKVDSQLADPSVSDYEKRKSVGFQNMQRGYLSEAQANLAEAQRRFTELTGRPASEANTTDWSPNASPTIAPNSVNSPVPTTISPFTRSSQNLFPTNSNTNAGSNFGLNSPSLNSPRLGNDSNFGLDPGLRPQGDLTTGTDLSTVKIRARNFLSTPAQSAQPASPQNQYLFKQTLPNSLTPNSSNNK